MIPLEGISDYVDITAVVNPWQAIVICVFLIALLVWPGIQSILTNRKVKEVSRTLTTNNGGSTVKDQLDRFETILTDHIEKSGEFHRKIDERVAVIEYRARRRWWQRAR